MVAGYDEGRDPLAGETLEAVAEGNLGTQRAVGALEHVAGNQHRIDLLGQGQVHDSIPAAQCGIAQGAGDPLWNRLAQAEERAVEVQVARMDEPEPHPLSEPRGSGTRSDPKGSRLRRRHRWSGRPVPHRSGRRWRSCRSWGWLRRPPRS